MAGILTAFNLMSEPKNVFEERIDDRRASGYIPSKKKIEWHHETGMIVV
mgnify:FL=1